MGKQTALGGWSLAVSPLKTRAFERMHNSTGWLGPERSGGSTPAKIPVIFLIDVEPDPFLVNRFNPEPWLGYEGIQGYLRALRARFENATGSPVHYTWCFRMDPQVAESYGSPTWAVDRYPDFIREIDREGDGLGTHPHVYRWLADQQQWLEDAANRDWVTYCVEMSLNAHQEAFGRPCETLRFGNFGMGISTYTVNLLERLGVRHEMSVEPGLSPTAPGTLEKGFYTGNRPDFRRVPRSPYEPSASNFLVPEKSGSRSLKIIPLTAGALQMGLRLRARWRRIRENGFRYRHQDTILSMWRDWKPPNTFDKMVDRALAAQANPYLAFGIRSSIGVGRSRDQVDRCLHALLEHPERRRFVFTTPAEALAILDGRSES
jgi:hypothetical protein